ncbi:ABC transporter ATP-binding protein [Vibrio cholerae]|uniref:ABC transporter ATP-binding protein n=1 Tax=Vibrio cholerae TaxID=666 RepID=UPI0004E2C925|nr:ABC transporter ATP-binding protein [Vibrio cholerae]EGR1088994.1 ABC transporter ATP-binding protein [Vibrio cholerae]KFE23462.1 ABC transporter family protein [Vibrio cholerae]TXZ28694.1 ABC transporter ATP-binding protein [Vibrio cholerae]BCK27009.1 Teichoic acids export ATP-binding protein TagH [Vibrio cholerae]BCN21479.1 putative O-antigen export system, ATP binding protein [Vibrio cholerae]
MTILKVNNLSKSFKEYKSPIHRVLSWFGLSHSIREKKIFHSISFEVARGESVGIVGLNGAGKSTLLKIIAGTLKASSGTIFTQGSISAILELGMGFNPEFSGRRNSRYALSLMGYSSKRINELIDEIERFSELGDYFDKPIRLYSSGMQMRVAFSVATAVEPDLLIIDEALAVGDIFFQQKCLSRIKRMQAKGTAILLVTHDPNTIREFCNSSILIENGCAVKGDTKKIIDYYESQNVLDIKHQKLLSTLDEKILTDRGYVSSCIAKVTCKNELECLSSILTGATVIINIKINLKRQVNFPVVGVLLKDSLSRDVFTFDTKNYFNSILSRAENSLDISFEMQMPLSDGNYFISVSLADNSNDSLDILYLEKECLHISIYRESSTVKYHGVFDMKPKIVYFDVR